MAAEIIRIPFKRCEWRWWTDQDYLETVFWDELRTPAAPEHDRDIATARDYGYGENTWKLFLHHDLAHTHVMESLGFDFSPTLRSVASHEYVSKEFRSQEECLIAECQRYLNGGPEPKLPLGFAKGSEAIDWQAWREQFHHLIDAKEKKFWQ